MKGLPATFFYQQISAFTDWPINQIDLLGGTSDGRVEPPKIVGREHVLRGVLKGVVIGGLKVRSSALRRSRPPALRRRRLSRTRSLLRSGDASLARSKIIRQKHLDIQVFYTIFALYNRPGKGIILQNIARRDVIVARRAIFVSRRATVLSRRRSVFPP